jgi:hypothetical protein
MPEVTDPKTGKKKHFSYDAAGRQEAADHAKTVGSAVKGGHHPGRAKSPTKRSY